jgi:hypothetical protein
MNLLSSVAILILWSSNNLSRADETDAPLSSVAIPSSALTYSSNLKFIDPKTNVEIKDESMPPVQSQDTVGSCFGCAASTIVQKFLCDSDPDYKGLKCNNLPKEKMVSQFSMVAWADTNLLRYDDDPNGSNQLPGESKNHSNIKLYGDVTKFSSGANALRNSIRAFKFMPESCYPFDQLVSKYGNKDSQLFKEVYEKTKSLYERLKGTEASSECEECLQQLNSDFNTSFSKDSFTSALQKNTYGEFLFALLFKNCKPLLSSERPKFYGLPENPGQKLAKTEVLEAMKGILNKKKPFLINSLCLEKNSQKCLSNHSTVISGYRKACPSSNYNDSKCKFQLKIHNCWGKDWQTANNDGWLDAAPLIENINYGKDSDGRFKDYILGGEISWLE